MLFQNDYTSSPFTEKTSRQHQKVTLIVAFP
jgi:hypothetical protein